MTKNAVTRFARARSIQLFLLLLRSLLVTRKYSTIYLKTRETLLSASSEEEISVAMVFKKQIPPRTRALALYLHKYGKFSLRTTARECGISKSSVERICATEVESSSNNRGGKQKPGRPNKLSTRDIRKLIRTLKTFRKNNVHVTVKSLVEESGLSFSQASRRTYSRYLNRLGYAYFSARRKGVLTEKDKKLRLRFARTMKREVSRNQDFWKNEIAFYLDGVSFVHKYNPRSGLAANKARVWRKREEGLEVTAKGAKDLAGGRRLHVVVAIAYGKGVILKVPYEKMTGRFFSQFVREHFNRTFAEAGPKTNGRRLFVMDNDPSQTSVAAKLAFEDIEAEFHEIPPRSPDLNPIENIFHLVKLFLENEAISRNITWESFEQFQNRVFRALESVSIETIDKTIASMSNRIQAILSSKGARTKY